MVITIALKLNLSLILTLILTMTIIVKKSALYPDDTAVRARVRAWVRIRLTSASVRIREMARVMYLVTTGVRKSMLANS